MTVKPESNFGRLLMKNIDAQWTRIENRHGGGIPDLYGIRKSVAIWIELKCIKQSHGITTTFVMVGKTIILSKMQGQGYSNCMTVTKAVS